MVIRIKGPAREADLHGGVGAAFGGASGLEVDGGKDGGGDGDREREGFSREGCRGGVGRRRCPGGVRKRLCFLGSNRFR